MRIFTISLLLAIGFAGPSHFLATADAAMLMTAPAILPVPVVDDGGCQEEIPLEFDFDGYDPSQKVARKEAHEQMTAFIQDLSQLLDEDCYIQSVVTSGTWDGGITYTLHAVVIIICDCEG